MSAGCANCYAAEAAKSARLQQFPQYQKVAEWDGKLEFVESQLLKPLSWKKPRKVFVPSMGDLFHDSVIDEWLDPIFAVMAIAQQHTFQVLTKRPERMQKYLFHPNAFDRIKNAAIEFTRKPNFNWPLPNVWLGVSVENQKVADRIPVLLKTPATTRFLSCEPLLENLDLESNKYLYKSPSSPGIDWVIIGGESGNNARVCNLSWIRSLVNQCCWANSSIFVKQLGSNCVNQHRYIDGVATCNNQVKTRDRKGGDINEFPEDLRIREFPLPF
ncbi:MAG: phage Gp37/Gp68 family protein [Oscillatoriaceae cyanobacterium Prado104]|nr:phage Gp37/Gp68 family protein [Oscillatoriaceae cyanobacterium Prado104]